MAVRIDRNSFLGRVQLCRCGSQCAEGRITQIFTGGHQSGQHQNSRGEGDYQCTLHGEIGAALKALT